MSPLAKSTIATVGSGVMAEAMIAGLLRGKLVEPEAGRRQPSARRAPRGTSSANTAIRTVASNVEAVDGADVILLGDQAPDAGQGRARDRPAPRTAASSS